MVVRATRGAATDELLAALSAAFRSIVRREHVSARHRALVRVRARWPDLLKELRGPGRRPRQ
jgi:hypothetical protein